MSSFIDKQMRKEAERKQLLKLNASLGEQVSAQSIKSQPTQVSGASSQLAGKASNAAMGNLGKAGAAMDIAKQTGLISSDPKSTGGSALSGAVSGAASGAMVGGVPGAIIGGAVGGVSGILGARSKRKAAAAQAQADHQRKLGDIEGQKTDRLNKALAGLASQFTATLT